MKIIGQGLTVDQWLTYVDLFDFGSLPPDRLVLHHTWKPTVAQWRGKASIDSLKRFYEGKGWPAGPHLFVGPDLIWLFTSMYEPGVHANAGNANLEFQASWGNYTKLKWYSVGVEMVGDYDLVRPGGVVWNQTKAVLGGLCRRLKLPVARIGFHRHFNTAKSCPGRAVKEDWVQAEVAGWLLQNPRLKRYRVVRATPVHQGPADTYPIAGQLGVDQVILVDSLHNAGAWGHMARRLPTQWDLGFVKVKDLVEVA